MKRPRRRGFHRLTQRQHEVLICRCEQGLTATETAARLFIEESTVKHHMAAILEVTGCRNIAQTCWQYRSWYEKLRGVAEMSRAQRERL